MPQLAKSILGRIEKLRGGLRYDSEELLVLNYHSTPAKFIGQFEKQVDFLTSNYNILGPSKLEDYFGGNLSADRAHVLLTFDDGLKNNLNAARVLEERNMRGYFFIVPAFIDTPKAQQKDFYLRNIRPVINAAIDQEQEDFLALDWTELAELIKKGHAMGAHTLTHTLLANTSTLENSESEIVQCKRTIENKLSVTINAFCSINNTLLSVGAKEKKLIEKNFRYHFTTLPGYNAGDKNPLFIRRRNVECYWPDGAFYYALGRSDLKRWSNKVAQYSNL
jgi:peptidoglycan/xylan/chitin deacetylase (PgdA/CDA1 family)